MKKTKTILLALTTLVASIAFAGETPGVPKRFEESFGRIFPSAANTDWVQKDELYIAEFEAKGIRHYAYFDADANLIATIRYVNTDYMPLRTLSVLQEKYGALGKKSVLEVSRANGDSFYLVELIHNNKFRTLKVFMDGSTEQVKKY